MGMIQKQRNWIPYELKTRDVEWRFYAYVQLCHVLGTLIFIYNIIIFIRNKTWRKDVLEGIINYTK